MGVLTLAEMETEVRYQLGGRSTDDLPNSRLDVWIRWAYRHVSRPHLFPHRCLMANTTFSLVTNQAAYAFTTHIGLSSADQLVGIRLLMNQSQGMRLIPRNMRQIDEVRLGGSGTTITGEPTHYVPEGTTLILYPTPTSTYNGNTMLLRYWRLAASLASSGAASELDEDWDEVIVQGAVWRGWRALNRPDRAEILKVEFAQLLNEVTDRLRQDLDDHGREVELEIEPWERA